MYVDFYLLKKKNMIITSNYQVMIQFAYLQLRVVFTNCLPSSLDVTNGVGNSRAKLNKVMLKSVMGHDTFAPRTSSGGRGDNKHTNLQ